MIRSVKFFMLLMLLTVSIFIRADDLMATLSERSHQIQKLEGRFEQYKTIAVLPVPLHSTGRFEYTKGEVVIWEVLEPVQKIIQLSADGIRFDGEAKQAPQAAVETITRIFMGVISGELSSLEEYFTIEPQGDSGRWKLLLKPNSANLAAYIQQIEIRGGEYTEQLDIAETNGDKTQVRFTTDNVTRIPH
jgi:hypothetical protein